jgi:hypothetical protein
MEEHHTRRQKTYTYVFAIVLLSLASVSLPLQPPPTHTHARTHTQHYDVLKQSAVFSSTKLLSEILICPLIVHCRQVTQRHALVDVMC